MLYIHDQTRTQTKQHNTTTPQTTLFQRNMYMYIHDSLVSLITVYMYNHVYVHVLQLLRGNVGLFFTNQPRGDVISWFQLYSERDYARAGCQATDDVILGEGPLEKFPHSMEPQLRTLGLPTTLNKGMYVQCVCGIPSGTNIF